MEVKIRGMGCVDTAGCFVSLGLIPIMIFMQINSLPRELTDEALITRNGKPIPWSAFTKAKITHQLVKATQRSKGTYQGTHFELSHPGGKLKFYTFRVANNEEVVSFITNH